jgi:hypothetical protein
MTDEVLTARLSDANVFLQRLPLPEEARRSAVEGGEPDCTAAGSRNE